MERGEGGGGRGRRRRRGMGGEGAGAGGREAAGGCGNGLKRAYSTACIKNHEVVRGLPANSRVWSACVDIHPQSRGCPATPPPPLASDSRAHMHSVSPTVVRREPIHPTCTPWCVAALCAHHQYTHSSCRARAPPLYLTHLTCPLSRLTCPPTTVRVGRTGARRCSSSCNCRRASRMHDRVCCP